MSFGTKTYVMGIINVTDDSFSGDGLMGDAHTAAAQAASFVSAGADLLDVGAESTRPGSRAVPCDEQLARVLPAIAAIRQRTSVPISIDTTEPEVARQAIEAGAGMINDVNGLRTEGMAQVAAQVGAPVIIMHMQGTPRTMQADPRYGDVVEDILAFLDERIQVGLAGGIAETQIIIDPGFGFGKTAGHNLEILRRLSEFRALGRPILMGTSRKSTIGKVLDLPAQERIFGTAATCAVAIHNGADIIRVHDVGAMAQVARMTDAILHGWEEA